MFPNKMQTIRDFQEFHQWLDQKNSFSQDIFLNTVLLCGEVGELAQILKKVHWMTEQERNDGETAITRKEALSRKRNQHMSNRFGVSSYQKERSKLHRHGGLYDRFHEENSSRVLWNFEASWNSAPD